ncbi:MAG: glutathione peroxidase [Verrucomicrobiales bacterium]|nr:glutathione peroxidase [Verrucomicrobiales bacterium]
MKKVQWLGILCVLCSGMFLLAGETPTSIYKFKATGIDGNEVDFAQFEGKAILIVNVASQCGATSQYEGLQALSEFFADKGLVVMGFPTNEFGGQEPGTNGEIKAFCSEKYNVTFPMFAKGSVKGADKSALFKYLTTAKNPDMTGDIGWNFEKFLIGKDGKLRRRFPTSTGPYDREFVAAVEKVLGEI